MLPSMIRVALPAFLVLLGACGEAPSWQKLLAARIAEQYPAYRVTPAGTGLKVERPGLADRGVDVDSIALLCSRGPKDCNRATDQMLLELRN